MKDIIKKNTFIKDFGKIQKQPNFTEELFNEFESCIETLANGKSLDVKYKDHPMKPTTPKKYKGMRDFHLRPNICVIYILTKETVELVAIGSHSYLGLTEKLSEKYLTNK